MADDRPPPLFFELFTGLPRQGPGDAASTRRALAMLPPLGPQARVLDLGCGTGAQTLTLAGLTSAHLLAVDLHPPFIAELTRLVRERGLADRVEPLVGDLRRLPFTPGSFDLVWCEGAIGLVGFDDSLRAWRSLLRPGGHLAATEPSWLRPDPPAECVDFWRRNYPAIRDVAANLAAVEACGFHPLGHFALPAAAWWDDYYRPIEAKLPAFRARHREGPQAAELADQVQEEIDVWRRYSDFYGYVFYVMRRD